MDISSFKGAFANGARPNLFEVSFAGGTIQDTKLLVKAASIPASTIASVDVPYMGRVVKVQGNRTYEDWQITVLNDEGFGIRTELENMMIAMNNPELNTGAQLTGLSATVTQKTVAGGDGAVYQFVDMFPTEISSIELAWDTNDSIEEYTVTFAYNYWTKTG
jgi:hypothetical protein